MGQMIDPRTLNLVGLVTMVVSVCGKSQDSCPDGEGGDDDAPE